VSTIAVAGAPGERAARFPSAGLATRPVLLVVAAKCALSLAFAGAYGWQRDELYYAVAGQHLQGGYVEFPPLTALLSALARVLFGWSLVGFRAFAVLAGAATIVLAALVARELGGGRRAQTLAAIVVAFSPLLLGTNGLFQPVSFDQTATMLVLWLALRLALGRGSWWQLGVAAGVGLETKYTLAVVLALLIASFAAWRRDVLRSSGFPLAIAVAVALFLPNLVWEAQHGWVSFHWFLNPPPSATDESRPQYLLDVLLDTQPLTVPVALAGVVGLMRDARLRPLGVTVLGTVLAWFLLGGKSYYGMPVVFFALAAGAPALDRRLGRRMLLIFGTAYLVTQLAILPIELPVLPLHTAIARGVVKDRSDYQDELGWPALARQVETLARGSDVVLASNYGEAGALEVFGHGLPPVASANVTFRYWRPPVTGRAALLVGFTDEQALAAGLCRDYSVVGRIAMPTANQERGQPIATCTLTRSLAALWPALVQRFG
jgi:Dolichyl-phosphate-mannose-protein mannosyltransferase